MTSPIRSFCKRLDTPNAVEPDPADFVVDIDVDMDADIGDGAESCVTRLLSSKSSCAICLTCMVVSNLRAQTLTETYLFESLVQSASEITTFLSVIADPDIPSESIDLFDPSRLLCAQFPLC